jgi:DNA polymerase (family 10)
MANGMDEARTLAHAARVRSLDGRYGSLRILAGVECDILPDGRMDLADECLAALDLVIASVHSAMAQSEDEMTARIIRAIEHPHVDIIGHPTNRLLLRRPPSQVNIANNVALEINSNPNRLDLSDSHARLARDRGVRLLVSSDAHSTIELEFPQWGVRVARRAWATSEDVLNAQPLDAFRRALKRGR